MKCKYKYCKNNGEVSKENAIKVGNFYYCQECYQEKINKGNIEKAIVEKIPTATMTIIRKVINQLINDKKYDSNYIYFVISKIINQNLILNSPFGLINYCSNNSFYKEWQSKLTNEKFLEIKNDIKNIDYKDEQVVFNINQNKKWTDIL